MNQRPDLRSSAGLAGAGILLALFGITAVTVFVANRFDVLHSKLKEQRVTKVQEKEGFANLSALGIVQSLVRPRTPGETNWNARGPAWFPRPYMGTRIPTNVLSPPATSPNWRRTGQSLEVLTNWIDPNSTLQAAIAGNRQQSLASSVVFSNNATDPNRPRLITSVDVQVTSCLNGDGNQTACSAADAHQKQTSARINLPPPVAPRCTVLAPATANTGQNIAVTLQADRVTTGARVQENFAPWTVMPVTVVSRSGAYSLDDPYSTTMTSIGTFSVVAPVVPYCVPTNQDYLGTVVGPVNDPVDLSGASPPGSCTGTVSVFRMAPPPTCSLTSSRMRFYVNQTATLTNTPAFLGPLPPTTNITVGGTAIAADTRRSLPFTPTVAGTYTVWAAVFANCGGTPFGPVNCAGAPMSLVVDDNPVCTVNAPGSVATNTNFNVSVAGVRGSFVSTTIRDVTTGAVSGANPTTYRKGAGGNYPYDAWATDAQGTVAYCGRVSVRVTVPSCACPAGVAWLGTDFYRDARVTAWAIGAYGAGTVGCLNRLCATNRPRGQALSVCGGGPISDPVYVFRPATGCVLENPGTRGSTSGGCFNPETPIRMADGSSKNAGSIERGDLVWDPIHAVALPVTEAIVGREAPGMFAIEAGGALVEVTEKHPFMTRHGYDQAWNLAAGDEILLANGEWRAISRIERRPAPADFDWVVNFRLGTDALPLDDQDAAVLANGIVTGDLGVQQRLERAAKAVP